MKELPDDYNALKALVIRQQKSITILERFLGEKVAQVSGSIATGVREIGKAAFEIAKQAPWSGIVGSTTVDH